MKMYCEQCHCTHFLPDIKVMEIYSVYGWPENTPSDTAVTLILYKCPNMNSASLCVMVKPVGELD